jgi:cell division protein FtsQ
MSVAVRDMMGWGMWRRRSARRVAPATQRRKPVAPVSRPWEGAAAVLRAALIMASGLLLAGVIGWLWATLTDPKVLPIKRLEVEGHFAHVDEQALRAAVTPYLKGNLLTADVRQVQRVVQALPWVREAEVRRVWPDGLHVTVREQTATALWGADDLVNDAG